MRVAAASPLQWGPSSVASPGGGRESEGYFLLQPWPQMEPPAERSRGGKILVEKMTPDTK